MRVFELAACNAFSLTSRSAAVLDLFDEGKLIECFDSVIEARAKADHYLADNLGRRRVAEAAQVFVREKGHTYLDRAEQLLRWLQEDQTK